MINCETCKYKDYEPKFYYRFCYSWYDYEKNFSSKNTSSLPPKNVTNLEEISIGELYNNYYFKNLDKLRYNDFILFIDYTLNELNFPKSKAFLYLNSDSLKTFILDLLPEHLINEGCLYNCAYYILNLINKGLPFIEIKNYIRNNVYQPHSFDAESSISFLIDFLYPLLGLPQSQDSFENKMDYIKNTILSKYNNETSKYSKKELKQKVRKGHGLLRKMLLENFGYCFLTNVDTKSLLEVSHSIPYSKSKNLEEALNPNNVLLLEVRYSKAFDRGLITFNDEGNIMYSSKLSEATLAVLHDDRFTKLNITLSDELKYYLKKHRESYFQK